MKYQLWLLIISFGSIFWLAHAQLQDAEFDAAIQWWFEAEMTQYDNQEDYRPFDTLTREQGAKMFSVFAMKNLCIAPDPSLECEFTDIESADPTLRSFITTSCELGLFQWAKGKFMPKEPLTKAQAITVLSRAIDGKQDESQNPRWSIYFEKARQHGITKETNVWNLDFALSRYEALLIQYRAKTDDCGGGGYSDDLLKALSELFGENENNSSPDSGDNMSTDEEMSEDISCSDDCSGTTFTVSVATKDESHPDQNGSSMGYVIDGVQGEELTLQRGETYIFNIDIDVLHPFYISTDSVGWWNGMYADGIVGNMTTDWMLKRTVSYDAPDLLYYECWNHPSMWWKIHIVDSCSCETIS